MVTLGIDLGTTSVKVCIVDNESKDVLQSISEPTNAGVASDCPLGDEQNVDRIIKSLECCMNELNPVHLGKVSGIGVCGQMHGCVLWRRGCREGVDPPLCLKDGKLLLSEGAALSNLYTWQDGRCDKEFLASLPSPSNSVPISTGYGTATLAWLNAHQHSEISRFDTSGTIMDLVVCGLAGTRRPSMSAHNAVSWGYYDVQSKSWDVSALKSINFPDHLLPEVVDPGSVAGVLHSSWHGIPSGVMITASLGDLQCSFLTNVFRHGRSRLVLNIGTSSQLILMSDSSSLDHPLPPSLMTVPYFNKQQLIVAASLNGGNVLKAFVDMLASWCSDLGVDIGKSEKERDAIYSTLIQKGQNLQELDDTMSVSVTPTLFGERHSPHSKGVVSNILPNPPRVGEVFHRTCRGLVENLFSMMPKEILEHYKVDGIIGCGSALKKNPLLQDEVRKVFSLPLVMTSSAADVGAALTSLKLF